MPLSRHRKMGGHRCAPGVVVVPTVNDRRTEAQAVCLYAWVCPRRDAEQAVIIQLVNQATERVDVASAAFYVVVNALVEPDLERLAVGVKHAQQRCDNPDRRRASDSAGLSQQHV